MYEIYSIGDATFLFGVLNAIAALAATDEYGMMARIGLMLGVLFVVGRAAISGGTQFPAGSLLGCLLLYSGLFGPRENVAIIDVYTDQVRTVDNVPLGIALAGSQVSALGYQVTRLMEQAFSTPRMTEQGYGAALETLKRTRLATISLYDLNLLNAPTADADWPRSWQQYIADCPLKGVQNENRLKDVAQIFSQPLLGDGLRFASDLWGTRLDLTRPYTEPTCSEGFEALVDYTVFQFLPYFKEVMAAKLGYASPAALETAIGDALGALGLAASADDYLATSALSAVYFSALRQRYAEDFQPAYATAVDDAVRQRNAQWLADESVFQHYMRPMITFLEAFIYAMTPFLVLLLGMGAYGIKVIFGFLTTLIWITTWMPVLAIINFFEHYVAAAKLTALTGSGGVDTMAGLFQADSIVQTYLAVGGNMAAAVPALTASFLFIGARAFGANLFAGRLASGDSFKEEKAAPDSYYAPAMQSFESPFTHTATGAHTGITGAARVTPSYNWSDGMQQQLATAERRMESVSESFLQNVGRRLSETVGTNEGGSFNRMFASTETASHSNAYAVASAWSASFEKGSDGTRGVSDELRSQVALGVQLGIPVARMAEWVGAASGRLVDPSLGAGATQGSAELSSHVERLATSMQDSLRNDHHQQAQFAAALATDVQHRQDSSVFANRSLQSDQGLQQQASEVLSATRDYQRTHALSTELSSRVSIAEPDLVGRLKRHPEVREWLGREAMESGLIGTVSDIESAIAPDYPNQADATIAAELRALGRFGSPMQQQMFLGELGKRLLLAQTPEVHDPRDSQAIGDSVVGFGAVRRAVEGMAGFGASLEGQVHARLGSEVQLVAGGPDRVAARSGENNAGIAYHESLQRGEAGYRGEVWDDMTREFGSSPNVATPIQDTQEAVIERMKDFGRWLGKDVNSNENLAPSQSPNVGNDESTSR